MSDIAILSSGDPVKDAEDLRQARIHDARMNEGLCPNGCAELTWATPYQGKCPVCPFMLSTNVPYGKRESDQIM